MASAITGGGVASADDLETPAAGELLRGIRVRSLNAETQALLVAVRRALRDAALDEPAISPDELGVVVTTSRAGCDDYVALFRAAIDHEGPHVNPARGPQSGLNGPAAQVSIRLGAAGPNATISNGAVGGLDALRWASDALAAGRAAAMLVCGVDLADAGGAAVVVLEPAARAQARARRANGQALVAGVATAHAPRDDLADASARALEEALREAGVAAGEIRDSALEGDAAVVAQLAGAASSLRRHEATGPLVVRACDGSCSAGAAVLLDGEQRA
jgi:3-oxoacyl-(acyl-carrier-protein) synthase